MKVERGREREREGLWRGGWRDVRPACCSQQEVKMKMKLLVF